MTTNEIRSVLSADDLAVLQSCEATWPEAARIAAIEDEAVRAEAMRRVGLGVPVGHAVNTAVAGDDIDWDNFHLWPRSL